jgi:hypothetical protein
MAEWNPNNRACTTTWSTLRVLDQNSKTFSKSGNIRMDQLTYWNPTATPQMRKVQATTLATQIDNFFVMVRGAQYEKNVTKGKAVNGIADTLLDEAMTIADLAALCDGQYKFWGEGINE